MTGLSLKTPQPKSCYGRDSSAIVALDVGQQIKAQLVGWLLLRFGLVWGDWQNA